jgi:hypothetical protein
MPALWDPNLATKRTYEIALEFLEGGSNFNRVCSHLTASLTEDRVATPEAWRAHLIRYDQVPLITQQRADREIRRLQHILAGRIYWIVGNVIYADREAAREAAQFVPGGRIRRRIGRRPPVLLQAPEPGEPKSAWAHLRENTRPKAP